MTVVMATTTPVDLVAPAGGHAGVRRRHRHPVRPQRRAATTARSTACSSGGRARPGPWRSGQRPHDIDLDRELRLLRQLLRRSLAVDRGLPDRGQSRSTAHRRSRRFAAGRSCTSTSPPGIPKILGIEPQKALMLMAQPQLFPWVRFEHRRRRQAASATGAAIIVAQPSLVLRPARHRVPARPARSAGPLPRQEGGLRRSDRRRDRQGHRRYPGRSRHRIRRSAPGGRGGARDGRDGDDDASGDDPAGTGVLRSRSQGPLGRRSAGPGNRRAGDPDRPVGHRRRSGRAARRPRT